MGKVPRILVFIPAYNEQDSIGAAIKGLVRQCPDYDYVVIDDGSTDRTREICERNGHPVISLPINLGLDGVFRTGIQYAYRSGYDIAVPFDGDGQHNAEYLPVMADTLMQGYDIVIGSRFLEKRKSGGVRAAGSALISFFFRMTTGQSLTDPTSGMRMVTRNVMRQIAANLNCGPEPDTWAYFVKNGAKLKEVQVEMNERRGGKSFFTPGRSIFFMLRICISIIFIQFFRKGGNPF